ncbi:GTP-binding protein, putative [Trypanosoma equiperdum]|uniref:GTP-binding protein, putative n=2 Tax=Trypanozoon TaxID=39700 RepID=Q584G8_TRYB2|nr:GTP-binding protein, putative [Trypanosoma brucei brucei TREU927]AAX79037.1 GTP-binding protein, putative [Trypanosoma brucei]AAZ10810.1 GTP-binding protein, putative [Trypanosoma brucei brucei TREU927]SCU69110.1 GTP-binding protein, putative [Trypanosoma equiperdum]
METKEKSPMLDDLRDDCPAFSRLDCLGNLTGEGEGPAVGLKEHALQQRAESSFDRDRRLAGIFSLDGVRGRNRLVKEDDNGNVEYKWRLTGVSAGRLEHLITQMRFRVGEGNGQCLYELGVADDGTPRGLSAADYQESVETLLRMAKALGLDTTVLQEFAVQETPVPLWCGEILVTQRQAKQQDCRVAFCGTTGSGKSTLMGVLLTGLRDDGVGSARQLIFNHKHEITTGKTSSIVTRVLPVTESRVEEMPFAYRPESSERPCRSITMIDLGGDVTKQMLFGLMSRRPDFTGITIAVDQSVNEIARYAQVCCAMKFPFFVVVTKIDTVVEFEVDAFLLELAAKLSTIGCSSLVLATSSDVVAFQKTWRKNKQVPLLSLSSVSNDGIEVFQQFLSSLPHVEIPPTPNSMFEVLLDGCFLVRGVGPVVKGHVSKGSVELGCRCNIGPDAEGKFHAVTVRGIHVDGSHVTRAQQSDEGTFALSELPNGIDMSQKGKMLIPNSVEVCWEFEALIKVLAQSITPQLEPILYSGNLRQAVKIVPSGVETQQLIDEKVLVRFRFLYHPEVMREGASIILQWQPSGIAVGEVQSVFANV